MGLHHGLPKTTRNHQDSGCYSSKTPIVTGFVNGFRIRLHLLLVSFRDLRTARETILINPGFQQPPASAIIPAPTIIALIVAPQHLTASLLIIDPKPHPAPTPPLIRPQPLQTQRLIRLIHGRHDQSVFAGRCEG